MTTAAAFAALFCSGATVIHLLSVMIVAIRCRARAAVPAPTDAPPVTIIRPLRGIDPFGHETLASGFALDYPNYELIFCVDRDSDPVAGLVRSLMASHERVQARLLIGEDHRSANPKLNNVLKGWDAARHPWIILADSNVLMPPDYVQRLMARWQHDTGLVCSMPIGSRPGDLPAMLECAFLNSFEARWQYLGETLGFGFAQGKSMLFQRDLVDRAGGLLNALGREIAEDAAFTKMVHAAGLRVHLVDRPFEQPLGMRTLPEVWARQRRWATLRRKTFPVMFALEILTGALLPILAGLYAAWARGLGMGPVAGLLAVAWFGAEALLAGAAGWPMSLRLMLACAIRDVLLPILWVEAWCRDDFTWRGNRMDVRDVPDTRNAPLPQDERRELA